MGDNVLGVFFALFRGCVGFFIFWFYRFLLVFVVSIFFEEEIEVGTCVSFFEVVYFLSWFFVGAEGIRSVVILVVSI